VVPLLADLRQSAVDFAGALVAYAAGLESQVCQALNPNPDLPVTWRLAATCTCIVHAGMCEDSRSVTFSVT